MKVLVLFLALLPVGAFSAPSFSWKVTKSWNNSYEDKFSEFIRIMGESGCKSLHACLTSASSNPFYVNKTPTTKRFLADCADLPYALRMYFAWMEGLPFDYVSGVAQAEPGKETSSDIRYTKFGNKPSAIRSFTAGNTYDGHQEMIRLINSVSTATFRMHYDYLTDFYPVTIAPKIVRAGTVAYDPAGHAAIIYKIEKDGRIKMMDAHPDQSITRITYDKKFTRSRPAHGAGLKNWRPELDKRSTNTLPNFSTEQFNKNFSIDGQKLSFYEFVRARLAGGSLSFDPVDELSNMMKELCSNLQDRVAAVDAAIKAGISTKNHPDRLPENIYGTSGEWEEYSTPSRDARLKVAFLELKDEVVRYLDLYKSGSKRVIYKPAASKYSKNCAANNSYCFLVASLMSEYENNVMSSACIITYKKSDGSKQKLSFTNMVDRLFKLSFDPYNCIELRWGANSREELASCRDDQNKWDWYAAEQGLRNQLERDYDQKMNFGLRDVPKLGVSKAPDIDLWSVLAKEL
ncbi:MAG: hypothetical protein M9962_14605 [Oligoflexia bacterium]|nr:hypothetical protein [Oligoflexia bacterium]